MTFYKNGVQFGSTKTSTKSSSGPAPTLTLFGKREINNVSAWDEGGVWSFTVEPYSIPIPGAAHV